LITKALLGLTFGACALAWAVDYHPLDVKTGQWESTITVDTAGMPTIPPETLARMSPEMRARIEEKTKALSGRNRTTKSCLKKENLDKPLLFGNEQKACVWTLATSSSTTQDIHIECNHEASKSTGTIHIQALNPENVKGSVQMTMTRGDHTMNINSSFTAHWVGAACAKEE